MKKLTKKQKAAYPEFIVLIDVSTKWRELFEDAKGYKSPGYYVKAMEETDIFAAMRRVENVIKKQGYAIYLVDILGKSGEEEENGEPIYEKKLRTRVHLSDYEKNEYGERKALPTSWHFCDEEHGESNDVVYKWYASKDRYGDLEWINKKREA